MEDTNKTKKTYDVSGSDDVPLCTNVDELSGEVESGAHSGATLPVPKTSTILSANLATLPGVSETSLSDIPVEARSRRSKALIRGKGATPVNPLTGKLWQNNSRSSRTRFVSDSENLCMSESDAEHESDSSTLTGSVMSVASSTFLAPCEQFLKRKAEDRESLSSEGSTSRARKGKAKKQRGGQTTTGAYVGKAEAQRALNAEKKKALELEMEAQLMKRTKRARAARNRAGYGVSLEPS